MIKKTRQQIILDFCQQFANRNKEKTISECSRCGRLQYMSSAESDVDKINIQIDGEKCYECLEVKHGYPLIYKWVVNVIEHHDRLDRQNERIRSLTY